MDRKKNEIFFPRPFQAVLFTRFWFLSEIKGIRNQIQITQIDGDTWLRIDLRVRIKMNDPVDKDLDTFWKPLELFPPVI